MKSPIKLIAAASLAAALFFTTTNVKAQTATTPPNPWRLGVGLELGAPTGNAHQISNFELGGTVRLQYDASANFAWTLTSGYYNMFGKNINETISDGTTVTTVSGKSPSLGIVPLKAGFKAFFSSNLYFGAEAGAGFETISNGDTKLILSPTLGYADKTWDVGVRYENFSGQGNSYGLAGLRIAYAFPL